MRLLALRDPRASGQRLARLALVAVASVALLTGCGTDSGGLTIEDRNAAQLAMNALQGSNIPTVILNLTSTAGQIPETCRVHLESRDPHAFKVYIFWIPYIGPAGYTWLDMTITKDPTQDKFKQGSAPSELEGGAGLGGRGVAPLADYDHPLKFTLGSRYKSVTQGVLKANAPANVFSKPGAWCQVMKNGGLRLLPND
jgi:hypothetical protein